MNASLVILPIDNHPEFTPWIKNLLMAEWGSEMIVSRGKVYDASKLNGYIALRQNKPVGLGTIVTHGTELEIITMNSIHENSGTGTAMINEIIRYARSINCSRVWLITTNDNIDAMRFYQKRNFRFAKIQYNTIEVSRKLKSSIPITGSYNLPVRTKLNSKCYFNHHD